MPTMTRGPLFLLLAILASPLPAASRYHLELEATPAAAFPYLGRFGAVELHVYASGVRAEALWLNSFAKNGAPAVTVANPLGRMYVDVPISDIAPTLQKLAGDPKAIERAAAPTRGPVVAGKVRGLEAKRHRLIYGPDAWVDYWTTTAIPENPQFRRIAQQLVAGISPGTAAVSKSIAGTPVYIELHFRRFRNVPLLKVKQLTFNVTAEEEREATELGPVYMRAPLLDKVLTSK
jgi:hypothetical protein